MTNPRAKSLPLSPVSARGNGGLSSLNLPGDETNPSPGLFPDMTPRRESYIRAHWGRKPASAMGTAIRVPAARIRELAGALGLDLDAEPKATPPCETPRKPRGWTKAEVEACREAGGPEWDLMRVMLILSRRKDAAERGLA